MLFALAVVVACALLGAEERPAPGGTYREGVIGQPLSLNPLLSPNDPITRDITGLVYAGLVRVRDGGTIEGDLAVDWKTTDDGQTYVFRLRPNASWHDGHRVTAADVLATVALLQSPAYPGPPELGALWRRVRAEALSPDTVSLRLDEPYASFIEACSVPILPAHVFGSDGSANLTEHPASYAPVGAGPFRVQSVSEQGIDLVRHEGYPGARPFLDRIELRFFADEQAAADALAADRIDGFAGLPPAAFNQLPHPDRYAMHQVPLPGHQTVLLMNHRSPILSDVAVRRAIALAVDRAALAEGPLAGQAVAAYGPVPAYSWAYDRSVEAGPDPGQAARLLGEAGWTGGPIRIKNGRALRLALVSQDSSKELALAEAIARQLAAIGIRVDPQPIETLDFYRERLLPQNYDLALVGAWLGTVDPDPYAMWHSSQRLAGSNFAGYQNPVADQLLTTARLQGDPEPRFAALSAFQHLWTEDTPSVVLTSPIMTYVMSKAIHGVQLGVVPEPGARFQHIAEWYVRTQRIPVLP